MFANIKIKIFLIKLLGELNGEIKNNNKQQELDRVYCH